MLFKIREAVWWVVAEIEDWLYPYYDRPVDDPFLRKESIEIDVESELRSQLQADNERIERLQSEMIYVQDQIQKLTDMV